MTRFGVAVDRTAWLLGLAIYPAGRTASLHIGYLYLEVQIAGRKRCP